ncbi:MAG: hypothetical protein OEY38_14220 [Gammaproteobacteria bacterium]|nr:hypothetical protein [Gammaproteobacteria bacterium]
MPILRLLVFLFVLTGIVGCVAQLKQPGNSYREATINKVVVLTFTVPHRIVYEKTPSEINDEDSENQILTVAGESDGVKAAIIAHKAFISELNHQDLSFEVLSVDAMVTQQAFVKHSQSISSVKISSIGDDSLNMSSQNPKLNINHGAAPANLVAFGFGSRDSALSGSSFELDYIRRAIALLQVDGAIVVVDSGMSFNCDACVLLPGGGANGVGSTRSSYKIAFVDRTGKTLLAHNGTFNGTEEKVKIEKSVISTKDHEKLFAAHGKAIAKHFSEVVKQKMTN